MTLERIDAFDVNFADSFTRKEFKIKKSTGTGEKRIYIGHDEAKYDDFFELENIECFITEKNDLITYLKDAYFEYKNPVQEYKEDIATYYDSLLTETKNIPEDVLKYHFRKTYDPQNRYYLVLDPQTQENKRTYDYIRNIALPRVTKLCFIKLKDNISNKRYIYMRPIFFNSLKQNEVLPDSTGQDKKQKDKIKQIRRKQSEYRQKLLEHMPFCPFTKVTDDRVLVACHIKPFSECNSDEEKYDYKNGITMTPTYHTLFDLGFITFEDNGTLQVSPFLSNINQERLHIKTGQQYRLQSGSEKYLKYHRENKFNNMPKFYNTTDFA